MLSSLSSQSAFWQQTPFADWDARKHKACNAGQFWQWDNVRFETLYPNATRLQNVALKDNDKSCVIKISSPYGSLLLTGDIERNAELELLASVPEKLRSDILIVPHHGSKTSSTPAFLEAVGARYAVITNGYLNRFGHPKLAVEQRYRERGMQVYRSDHDGAVQFVLQAQSPMVVTSWRKTYPRYWHDRFQD